MSERKTATDYMSLAKTIGYKWLGPEVPNTKTKTFWLCNNGHKLEKSYARIKSGRKCLQCSNESSRHSSEDYHRLAGERDFKWLGPEVTGVMKKTWWQCGNGHKWDAKYNHIKNGRGCPHCSHRTPLQSADYQQLAKSKGLEWLGPVVPDNRTKTSWRCDQNHEFDTAYTTLKSSKRKGCPYCAGKAHKTQEDYYKLAARHSFIWLGPMPPTVLEKTFWQCEKGHQWNSPYHRLDYNHGCPHCSLLTTQSKGERQVAKILNSFGVVFSRQKTFDKCKDKYVLRFDFYFVFADHLFLIEYNGQHHYKSIDHWGGEKEFRGVQCRDSIKSDFAAANGLYLIVIPYTDYELIETVIIDKLKEVTGESPFHLISNFKG